MTASPAYGLVSADCKMASRSCPIHASSHIWISSSSLVAGSFIHVQSDVFVSSEIGDHLYSAKTRAQLPPHGLAFLWSLQITTLSVRVAVKSQSIHQPKACSADWPICMVTLNPSAFCSFIRRRVAEPLFRTVQHLPLAAAMAVCNHSCNVLVRCARLSWERIPSVGL